MRIKKPNILISAVVAFFVIISQAVPVVAVSVFNVCGNKNLSQTNVCSTIQNKDSSSSATSLIQSITSIFSYIAGIVAVILIILAGFQFATSNGDSKKVQQARDTILYAGMGVFLVVIAQVILIFVSNKIG